MDKTGRMEALRREGKAFVEAVRQNTQPPVPQVPSCPEWNVTELVLHLGTVHRSVIKTVSEQLSSPPYGKGDVSYLEIPAPYHEWLTQRKMPDSEPLSPELIGWFEQGLERLVEVLSEADPEMPCWTWAKNQNAEHWQRMMPIETATHRWDAQGANGKQEPVETELALDGIDLLLDVMIPYRRERGNAPQGKGESYHFHRTDGPGEWLVRFEPDGVKVSREHAKGDVAVRGSASDLFLFLWNRIPASQLETFGDAKLVERYFELATPA